MTWTGELTVDGSLALQAMFLNLWTGDFDRVSPTDKENPSG